MQPTKRTVPWFCNRSTIFFFLPPTSFAVHWWIFILVLGQMHLLSPSRML